MAQTQYIHHVFHCSFVLQMTVFFSFKSTKKAMNDTDYVHPQGEVVGCVFRAPSTLFVPNVDVGWGLFVSDFCMKGTKIAVFYGEEISCDEKDERIHAGNGGYMIHIKNGVVMDCFPRRHVCMASLANSPHGAFTSDGKRAQANCKLVIQKGHAYLLAIRNMEQSEEVLWNYGVEYRFPQINVPIHPPHHAALPDNQQPMQNAEVADEEQPAEHAEVPDDEQPLQQAEVPEDQQPPQHAQVPHKHQVIDLVSDDDKEVPQAKSVHVAQASCAREHIATAQAVASVHHKVIDLVSDSEQDIAPATITCVGLKALPDYGSMAVDKLRDEMLSRGLKVDTKAKMVSVLSELCNCAQRTPQSLIVNKVQTKLFTTMYHVCCLHWHTFLLCIVLI